MASTLADRIDQRVFSAIYARSLVYNTCWEDPAVDREALQLRPQDTLLVITSAGCNVLDYALTGPRRIYAVDANPRQTALLELKLAAIRELDFEDFFQVFGRGYHESFRSLYESKLRAGLSPFAREYWDRRAGWFTSSWGSFYFHGLSGFVARAFRLHLRLRPAFAASLRELFAASSLDEQRQVYDAQVAPQAWGPVLRWVLSRQLTMSLLGVPHPQRREVEAQHDGGVSAYIRDSIEYVLRELPILSNYFWQLYFTGRYTRECCPEYLREANFAALKGGLVDRIVPRTTTVTEFLREAPEPISRFVLLDHMDWMAGHYPAALAEEWREIFRRATPDARIIFRSAHADPRYLDTTFVDGAPIAARLRRHPTLAAELTRRDRVHTYAGFHICDVQA